MTLFPIEMIEAARANAAAMENNRTLSPELLSYCYKEKLFKLFVPDSLDGAGLGLPDALRIFEKAAWIDGSFGWLVTIGSGGGFFSATLPTEQSRALFGDPKAVVAGSGHPNGVATPCEGGYIVSGQWKFCSGSTYASVFTANCKIEGIAEGEDNIRSFAFRPEQVEIIRDWNAFGLKATDSHSIAVQQAFVPADWTFDIMSPPLFDDPIYRYPFLPFAQTSFAAVCIGLGKHFLEETRAFADEKEKSGMDKKTDRLAALRTLLEEKTREAEAAAAQFYEAVDSTWAEFAASGVISDYDVQEVGRRSCLAARTAVAGAEAIFPLLGMTALMEDHPLNRTWRDLHTAAQHSALRLV